MPSLVATKIEIVGGGIAGLAASIYRAREGRAVTIFERRRDLGGRAVTHLRKGFPLQPRPPRSISRRLRGQGLPRARYADSRRRPWASAWHCSMEAVTVCQPVCCRFS